VEKLFLQPNASLDTANAQLTRGVAGPASKPLARHSATGDYQLQRIERANSSTGCFRKRPLEDRLNDLSLNFLRTRVITVPGVAVPHPYGANNARCTSGVWKANPSQRTTDAPGTAQGPMNAGPPCRAS